MRLFISSTFKDMKEERDIIHSEVFPKVRQYGLKKGINVDICDLRWGIRDEEAATISNIMEVCFKEIKHCKPFIISMIGEHYGTIQENADEIIKKWNSIDDERNLPESVDSLSLTQWELEFSLLSDINNETKGLCLIRDKKNIKDENIRKLIQRVEKKISVYDGSLQCVEYSKGDKYENFKIALINQIKKLIDEESKNNPTNWIEKNYIYYDSYCKERVESFYGRKKQLDELKKFIRSKKRILELYGESGIGKTSLMSAFFDKDDISKDKLIIYVGKGEKSVSYIDILKQIIYFLKTRINEKDEGKTNKNLESIITENDAELLLRDTIVDCQEKCKRVTIYIDAAEKIVSRNEEPINRICEQINFENIKLVYSHIEGEKQDNSQIQQIKLGVLKSKDVHELLNGKLYVGKNKIAETDSIIEKIMKHAGERITPIYLNAIIIILRIHMGDFPIEKRNEEFGNIIEKLPKDPGEICLSAIDEAIKYITFGDVNEKELKKDSIDKAMKLIALSNHGLRMVDINNIMNSEDDNWSELLFSKLRLFLINYFRYEESGFWVFEHDVIKNSLLNKLKENQTDYREIKNCMYNYVCDVEKADSEIRIREGLLISSEREDINLAMDILNEVCLSDIKNKNLRTATVVEMYRIFKGENGEIWLDKMRKTHLHTVIKVIYYLLKLDTVDEYERRIPAKIMADFIINPENKTNYDGQNLIKELNTEEEQFDMALLFTEYISVYESVGKQNQTYYYEQYPIEVLKNQFEQYKKERAATVFNNLNVIFYVNNKLTHDKEFDKKAKETSEKMISFFMEQKAFIPKFTYAKIFSNIGQFYNGQGNYNLALKYHLDSLKMKADILINTINEMLNEEKSEVNAFYEMCDFESISEQDIITEFKKSDIDAHEKYWCVVEKIILDECIEDINEDKDTKEERKKKEEKNKKLAELWITIGVGYRTIASDLFVVSTKSNLGENVIDELVELGCSCHKISYIILDGDIIKDDYRDVLATTIREIGFFNVKKQLSEDDKSILSEIISRSIYIFEKNYIKLGVSEGLKLCLNTKKILDRNDCNDFNEKVLEQLVERIKEFPKSEIDREINNRRVFSETDILILKEVLKWE